MATTLVDGFYLNTALPLDIKTHVADVTARNAIPALHRYAGMAVYCIAENKTYRLVGGLLDVNWQEASGGGGVRVVADDTARDAIPSGERAEGSTVVYVIATKKNWQLQGGITNADWKPFGSGSGVVVVADYTALLDYPDADRADGMIFYVQDVRENWQCRGGVTDLDLVNLDELGKIYDGAAQTLTAGGTATLENTERQKILVQVTGSGLFVLPNPSGDMKELYIEGNSDDNIATLATGFINGTLTGNVASNGDIDFSKYRIEHFIADVPNGKWIRVGGF